MASLAEIVKKQQNKFVTNREDARQLKGLAKRQAATEARLNAAPEPIVQTNPKPVSLANAKPSVMEGPIKFNGNPDFVPDTHGQVTRGQAGTFQSQEQRNTLRRTQTGPTTTVQQDRLPQTNKVEVVRGGETSAAGDVEKIHYDTQGGTISDADLKQQNLQRARAKAVDEARRVMSNTKAYSQAQVKAAGEFLASGQATEAVGEFAGRQAGSAGKGFNQGLSDVAAVEAETPLPRSATTPEEVVLKGPAEPTTLRTPPPDVPGAAPVAEAAPKPQRNIGQRIGDAAGKGFDTLKNALPDFGGGTPPASVDPAVKSRVQKLKATLGPALLADLGTMYANEVAQFGLEEGTASAAKKTGVAISEIVDLAAAGEIGEIGKGVAIGLADLPGRLASNIPTSLAGGFSSINEGLASLADSVGLDGANFRAVGEASDQFIKDVNDPYYAGDNPLVALIGAFKHGSVADIGQVPAALRQLTGREPSSTEVDSVVNLISPESNARVTGQVDEALAGSRAQDGLRAAPANNDSYFVNNGAGDSGFEGLAGGTGGEAEGEKQFLRDLPQAFPNQPEQERGLGAARNEISGRGRFNKDNAVANFAGEFAHARQSSDRAAFDQKERKNRSTLAGAASTANTAKERANADLSTEFYKGLNDPDPGVQKRTKNRIFADFQKQRFDGNLDRNSASYQAAASLVTEGMVLADNEGLGSNVWNTLTTWFGSGQGVFDLFNGQVSVNAGLPFKDIKFDGNEMLVRSTETLLNDEGQTIPNWVSIGEFQDPDVVNFLRHNASSAE